MNCIVLGSIHRSVIEYLSRQRWAVFNVSYYCQNSPNSISPALYISSLTRSPLRRVPLSLPLPPLPHWRSLMHPVSTQRRRSVYVTATTCGSSVRRERFLVRGKCVKLRQGISVSLKMNSSQSVSPPSPLRHRNLRKIVIRLFLC